MSDSSSAKLDPDVNDKDCNGCHGREDHQEECTEVVEVVRETVDNLKRSPNQDLCVRASQVYRGHHFKDTVARDSARVQYGDVYNIESCKHHSSALQRHPSSTLRAEKFEEVQVQAAIVTLLVLRILENFLEYLLYMIPASIGTRISVLEDAFGRKWRIDVDTIATWAEFDSLLFHKFENLRGLRRIQSGDYRLHTSRELELINSKYQPSFTIINPKYRPSFTIVFKPGQHIRMSIYFSWDEVQHHGCPRCKTEQPSVPGLETTCRTCAFAYISGLLETVDGPVESDTVLPSAEVETPVKLAVPLRRPECIQPSRKDLDRPENFNRISIGAGATTLAEDSPGRKKQSVSSTTSSDEVMPPPVRSYFESARDVRFYRRRLEELEHSYQQSKVELEFPDEAFERNYRNDHEQISNDLNTMEAETEILRQRCVDEGFERNGYITPGFSDSYIESDSEMDVTWDDPSQQSQLFPAPVPDPTFDWGDDLSEPPQRKRRYIPGGPGGGGRFIDDTESDWASSDWTSSEDELTSRNISGPRPRSGETSRLILTRKEYTIMHDNVKVRRVSEVNLVKSAQLLRLDNHH